ncbi:MAG: GGDEF domain-containing protein [Jaaginema sp. PMC 1079.18]|nr:GGDEF domain-containing protein [Jaaginema sp. PMC 1080.18]MEC4852916.1 GGDEF domain-containing protein [Jaaginema sp. PMC 1079.18]MEC4868665.1 GGDEF domain-containing protein [Jaaginema sp. PMC 1078.18]
MDIPTLTLVVAIASLLHAVVLLCCFSFAARYQGLNYYLISTILSACAFACFLIRYFEPSLLILRFLGNLFLCISPLCYAIAMSRFVGLRDRRFSYIILAIASLFIQLYLVYFKSSFLCRNLHIILITNFAYTVVICYLWKKRNVTLQISTNFAIIALFLNIVMLTLRVVAIPLTQTESLFTSNLINASTFWVILIGDYLRHAGFMMMVFQRLYSDLEKVANLDYLTGLLNRRSASIAIEKEIQSYERDRLKCSLILLDVDRFKSINDNYGHYSGDLVLQHIAQILQNILKPQDIIGRWGGEEFLIALPQTPLENAYSVAEKIRLAIAQKPCEPHKINVTISSGVATFPQHGKTLEKVVDTADKALYYAKTHGRNQVAIASIPSQKC